MKDLKFTYEQAASAAAFVKERHGAEPEIGMVLGSALGSLARSMENPTVIDYAEIPGFLLSTVSSHAGKLILGKLDGRDAVCMSGRFHYYEGYDYQQLTAPMRLFKLLGVKTVILTNAAGGINTGYRPGDLMIIKDHINLAGASPMRGPNDERFGPRFFDVSDMYTPRLRKLAMSLAGECALRVHEGVYAFMVGPHFETPAEIRFLRAAGADAVGMSTVTEALTAAHCGMEVLAISMITNPAAGVSDAPLSGDDVDKTAAASAGELGKYIRRIAARI